MITSKKPFGYGYVFISLCGITGGVLMLLAWLGLIPIDPDVVLLHEPLPGRTDLVGCKYPAALVTKTGLVLRNRPGVPGGASTETITDLDTGQTVWQWHGRPIHQGKSCVWRGPDQFATNNMPMEVAQSLCEGPHDLPPPIPPVTAILGAEHWCHFLGDMERLDTRLREDGKSLAEMVDLPQVTRPAMSAPERQALDALVAKLYSITWTDVTRCLKDPPR